MKVIIAEKPSVAQGIASVVGARQRKDGYLTGDGYAVTWAFGHLVGLAMPESYGFSGFRREHLPILPQEFRLVPRQMREGKVYKDDPGVVRQLEVLRELFDRCESIIVATDAGREGELIFRYVYNYLGCTKPFVRLWISSLTDKAIREGLRNLREGSLYDNLYLSAKARSEADWLVGINSSQALSLAAGQGVFSLGRVQTPTLAMICSRYRENKQFVPRKYFQIKVSAAKDGIAFSALSRNRFDDLETATAGLREVEDGGMLAVSSVERREAVQEPPLLYDLTALQKEANGKLDFSADKTLTLAQSLYEKKVLSYPRTGSRYISEDVFEEIPSRITLLQQYPRFAAIASALRDTPLNRRPVDDAKVTDHHALLVTENLPEGLSQDEQAIYEMVAARLLEAFSPHCVKEMTEVALSAGGEIFTLKGRSSNPPVGVPCVANRKRRWRKPHCRSYRRMKPCRCSLPKRWRSRPNPNRCIPRVRCSPLWSIAAGRSATGSCVPQSGRPVSELRPPVRPLSRHCSPVTIYAGTRRTLCPPKKDWRFTIR